MYIFTSHQVCSESLWQSALANCHVSGRHLLIAYMKQLASLSRDTGSNEPLQKSRGTVAHKHLDTYPARISRSAILSSYLLHLHRLEVVVLLDLGLPLLPHRLPQLLALLRCGNGILHGTVGRARQVDRLLLQGNLGRQGLNVAGRQDPSLELALLLGC